MKYLVLMLSTLAFAGDKIEVDRQNCNVSTYFAQNVAGGQCRYLDQIMVGIKSVNPLIIRCATLEVKCLYRPSQDTTDVSD